jgi:hypothetical protein
MPFEAKALDSTIDLETATTNIAQMVQGRGQMVYWKGCNVTVYDKDGDGKTRTKKLAGMPDGQGRVPSGTKLYITEGRFKEEG